MKKGVKYEVEDWGLNHGTSANVRLSSYKNFLCIGVVGLLGVCWGEGGSKGYQVCVFVFTSLSWKTCLIDMHISIQQNTDVDT